MRALGSIAGIRPTKFDILPVNQVGQTGSEGDPRGQSVIECSKISCRRVCQRSAKYVSLVKPRWYVSLGIE